MDQRLQRRVQRYGWDKAAAHYERYWSRQLEPAQTLMLRMASLRPGERALDVACGTGLVTFRAADAVGANGTVVATDISEAMVTRLLEVAKPRGLTNVTAERMDAEDLRLPDAAFDVALCALGLMYFPDPQKAIAEMLRVVRPGGRVVTVVWGARSRCGWAEIFPIVDRRVQSEVCPLFFQLGTGDTLRLTMEQAGCTAVEIERLSITLRYDSADDAVGAAFAGGPVALAYSRFTSQVREEAHTEYLNSIEAFRGRDGRYEIPGEFVAGLGWRRA
ncbi:MAG TPA: methyltransferase domain-containing protein [Gemmatimonadales bacterium]|nr:methyltransferase domain-containing protein [Gemmatimonadales bacterium]